MNESVAALVLAGGRGERMGEGVAKHLRLLDGRSLLDRAIERAGEQARIVLVSCNEPVPHPVPGRVILPDTVPGRAGPLAGILAGLEHLARHHPDIALLASIAVDTPWFPADLLQRLARARAAHDADIALACSGGRAHPVFALWPVGIATELRHALIEQDVRAVRAFQAAYRITQVEWPAGRHDPFFNVNTPADLRKAEQRLQRGTAADDVL